MRILVALLMVVAACAPDPLDEDEPGGDSSELTVSAIPRRSVWRYWDLGGDLGTTWRGTLDDASWASGAGPLGYGESYLSTTVGFGPSASNKFITTYFRRTFTVDDPATVTAITGEVMYDDGIVVYINGTRIGRDSMPSGTITASTLSTGHEANNAYRTYDWTAQKSLLVAGTNVIAVEVHQASAASSDLVFDLSLTLETMVAPVEFEDIPRNSGWWFWDNGGDLGTSWRTQQVGGEGWDFGTGAFGYGETYLQTPVSFGPSATSKFITTYFTTYTYLDNPTAVTRMIGEVMYDDGFVVYLNGVEIGRSAMPAGAVTASTLSTGHEALNTYQTFDWSSKRGALVPGINVVAVEVHQSSPSSSDLVFDLALLLFGEQPAPPPTDEDIVRRSTWRYWDRPEAPSVFDSWAQPDYNDAVWASGGGPLGYGETYIVTPVSYGSDPRNKTITTYFRRWFTVDAPSVETTLIADLMYDDGLVVHLNGHEITRLHMPAGTIEHTTLSTGHETGNTYERYDWSAFSGHLVRGPNLLAVEVHQAAPTSSDLTFDLALQVDTPAVCAIPGCGPGVPPPPAASLNGVWAGPTAAWTVGDDGVIGRRTDAAGEWCWCASDPAVDLHAIWGIADDDVWIVGSAGRVLHYDGTSLTTVDAGTTATLRSVWGTGAGDVWVVGGAGTVRHFDGLGWQARSLAADQGLRAVWAASPTDVWVAGVEPALVPDNPEDDGSSAIIYRWAPATGTWTQEVKDTTFHGVADFSGLHGSSVGDVWAVGLNHPSGAACSYSHAWHYDGVSWSSVPITDELVGCRQYLDVAAGAPGAEDGAWIVGGAERGAVRYDGGVWSAGEEPITTDLNAIDYRGTRMWAVGNPFSGQKIIRWDGTQWVQEW